MMAALRPVIRPSPSRFAGALAHRRCATRQALARVRREGSPQAGRGDSPLSSLSPLCGERAGVRGFCAACPALGTL
jgi:hypothetical protein